MDVRPTATGDTARPLALATASRATSSAMMRAALAVIVIIIVATGLAWHQDHRPEHRATMQATQALSNWPTLNPDEITAITLRYGDSTVRLRKAASGSWQLVDPYGQVAANTDLVHRLLRDITAMRPQQLITTNPNNFNRFRLGSEADRLTVQGDGDTPLLDLLVGKPGTDLISTTVRRRGMNQVVTVDRSLGWQLGRTAKSWRAPKPPTTPKPRLSDVGAAQPRSDMHNSAPATVSLYQQPNAPG
ncbi:MAG: DUF4340 domain-containing protein [Mariprofundales bacterium]|nr:DUF4340 domain-containing protein [Mariprofundales bacterium]